MVGGMVCPLQKITLPRRFAAAGDRPSGVVVGSKVLAGVPASWRPGSQGGHLIPSATHQPCLLTRDTCPPDIDSLVFHQAPIWDSVAAIRASPFVLENEPERNADGSRTRRALTWLRDESDEHLFSLRQGRWQKVQVPLVRRCAVGQAATRRRPLPRKAHRHEPFLSL